MSHHALAPEGMQIYRRAPSGPWRSTLTDWLKCRRPAYTVAATSATSGRTLDATVPITLPPRGRQ
jgi:hypothetical protein